MKSKIIAATVAVAILITAFILGASGTVDLSKTYNSSEADSLPELEQQPEPDKLIGIFATREPLQKYYHDEIEKSSEMNSDGQRRFYADINEKTEQILPHKEYSFKNVEGYCFSSDLWSSDIGTMLEWAYDDVVSDYECNINISDTGNANEYKGTIYLTDNGEDNGIWTYVLYQTPTDEIYAVSNMMGNYLNTYCPYVTVNATNSEEEKNGYTNEVNTESIKFSLTIELMPAPEKTVISQFDSVGSIISRDEYIPGSVPENITANENTAYFVTEEFNSSEDSTLNVKRTIVEKDVDSFVTYVPRDDHVCEQRTTEIIWPEQANEEQVNNEQTTIEQLEEMYSIFS